MADFNFDLVYLAIGAVAGAYLRYRIGMYQIYLAAIPVSILIINVLGSFILGLSMTAIIMLGLNKDYTILFAIGFCGSFTTMSSFAYDSVGYLIIGDLFQGFGDIALNLTGSLLAVYAGIILMKTLINLIR